jgi:hypothetical protein
VLDGAAQALYKGSCLCRAEVSVTFRKHVVFVTCLFTALFFAAVTGPLAHAQKSKKR